MSQNTQELIDKVKALEGKLSEELNMLESRIKSFHSDIQSSKQKYDENYDKLHKEMLQKINNLIETLNKAFSQIEETKSKGWVKWKDQVTKDLAAIVDTYEQHVRKVKEDQMAWAEEQAKKSKDLKKQLVNNLQQVVNANFGKSLTDEIDSLNESFGKQIETTANNLKNLLESQLESLRSVTSDNIGRVIEELKHFKSEVQKLTDTHTAVEEAFSTASSTTEGFYEGVTRALEDQVSLTIDNIREIIKTQEDEFSKQLDALKKNFDSLKEKAKQTLAETLNAAKEAVNQEVAKQQEKISELVALFIESTQMIKKNDEELMENLMGAVRKEFRAKLYNELSELTASFNSFQDNFIGIVDDLISRLNKARATMQSELENTIINRVEQVSKISTDFESRMELTIKEVLDARNKQNTQLLNETAQMITQQKETFTNTLTKLKNDWVNKLSENSNALEEIINSFDSNAREQFTKTENLLLTTNKKTVEQVTSSLQDFKEKQAKDFSAASQDSINTLKNQKDNVIREIANVQDLGTSTADSFIEKLRTQAEEANKSLTGITDETTARIETIKRDSSIELTNIIEGARGKIDERIKTSNQTIKESIEKNTKDFEQELIQIGKTLSSNLEAVLTEFNSVHEKAKKSLDNLIQKHQNALANTVEAIKEQIEQVENTKRELTATFAKIESSAVANFSDFEKNLKIHIENVQKRGQEVLKHTEDFISLLQQSS